MLFYWNKESKNSEANVDYLVQIKDKVVPIEVKASLSRRIKSMYIFFETHLNSNYGIRFWVGNFETKDQIVSYPLYAVFKPLVNPDDNIYRALKYLTEGHD